ncbi:UNVERIFIED_CONTAM: hypothetical protein K2H54_014384 [Gekko kuhli]
MRGRMGTQGSPVKSYDYLLKFLLVGDSDVGKGEILESLQDGASESPYAYSNVFCVAYGSGVHKMQTGPYAAICASLEAHPSGKILGAGMLMTILESFLTHTYPQWKEQHLK